MRAGSTVFLNSFHEGGLLFLGDVHGSQGDSKLTMIANETSAEVTLSVEIVAKDRVPSVLRIETPDKLVQVDAMNDAGTLQNTLENCFIGMMKWLIEDYEFSQREAYLHLSINPGVECHVYQFIPELGFVTCGVEFPVSSLEPTT
ncbi:acetamidase/formamidase family protein [Haladaptatus caseinilyticus]|uniref:acetamidase/formamidase family protein n=1 Tax=Haladaptatus caseinilyticus TaxID=2993314 RepID=UPI00224A7166|nr:acetamidase/formamidase family protein [Haladaptatus caseinilyticus]